MWRTHRTERNGWRAEQTACVVCVPVGLGDPGNRSMRSNRIPWAVFSLVELTLG